MKRILLITLLALSSTAGYSNSFVYLFGGAGLAAHDNYDCGITGGITYFHALGFRMALGASVLAQQYNLYYDQQANDVNGATIRHKSTYAFFSPMLDCHLGKHGTTHFYITAGLGYNISAIDSMHKWSAGTLSSPGYDSIINNSANVNKMISRIAIGLTEHCAISKHFGVSFTEDLAFLPSLISSTTLPGNTQLNDNLGQLFRPTYFTLRIGFYYKSN